MIILMGVLGAGKSVQGELLAEKTGYKWLSTGVYIRENATGEMREKMLRGELLDDSDLFEILSKLFSGRDSDKVILDGFPRTIGQAEWLAEQKAKGVIVNFTVVFLDASKDVAKSRLLSRGRPDDSEEIIDRRIADYEKLTKPVVDWFERSGAKVVRVNADQTVDEVRADILSQLGM